jgi:long-chain acyl-CoA synthetase
MINENLIGFEKLPQTIPHFCLESFRRNAKPDALSYKIQDVWRHFSGAETIEKIKHIALGLSSLGVKAGDKVAIISENRPEWSLTDLAILSLRAVNVPIYTTQAVEQIRYILEDSGAKMLFVSGKKFWKHAENAIQSVERLEKLIFFDDDAKPEERQSRDDAIEIENRRGSE